MRRNDRETGMSDLTTAIVLAFNKAAYTARCLDGLAHSTYRPFEVVLVDNGSNDETPQVMSEFESRARGLGITTRRINNDTNVGASTGRNQGLDVAAGRYIAFMDNDVVVRSVDWIERLADVLEMEDRAGIAGPKLIFPFPPYLIQNAGAAVSPTGRVFYLGRGEPRRSGEFTGRVETQCLISACWLMKRELVDAFGGLDEAYNPVQFEDIDFCYRVRAAGWRTFCDRDVEMYHFENVTTSGSKAINSPYQIAKNGMLFKRRWLKMFRSENGPKDSTWHWAEVPIVSLDSVPDVEFVGECN
jgi:GT2 family glycosyltransferase